MKRNVMIVLLGVAFASFQGAPGQAFVGGLGKLTGAGPAVKAEALLDTTALAPGKTAQLAVVLTTAPDYHIYWSNPGEGGVATSINVEGPAGFKIQPLAFPAPHRFVQPGNITVYGYSGKTVFLFNITPPADFTPMGAPTILGVSASWLNCNKDACTPGSAKLAVPITLGAGQPANADLFAAAREAIPADKPPANIKQITPLPAAPAADGLHQLGATIAWSKSPGPVEAFPEDVEGLHVEAVTVSGDADTTRITLKARAMGGYKLATGHLNLVVACESDKGRTAFTLLIDLRPVEGGNPQPGKP